MTPTLKIQNGELVPVGKALWEDFLGKNDGEIVNVVIADPLRSSKSNRYMWGAVYDKLVQKWRLELGWDKDDIHDYLKSKLLKRTLPNGEQVVGSTSKMTQKAFNQYVNDCIIEAAKHGIVIEDSENLESLMRYEPRV